MRYALGLFVLLAVTSLAFAQDAQQLASSGKWKEAIEAYGKEVSQLTAQQYRDKKDFGWILEEYEKQSAGDFEPLKKVLAELTAKYKGNNVFEWRLHRLLGDIAEKQGDKDAQAKALEAAISAYPPDAGNDPAKHSSLQHMYNQRALLMAEKDVQAAEEYILKSFKSDKRFVYFFGHTWQEWFQQHEHAARYQPLMQKVLKAYGEKASSDGEHRPLLVRYSRQLATELKQKQQ